MVEPGIEPGTSWLVVRSSDHQTTRLVCILYNPEIHNRIHNSQPSVHIQVQINTVRAPHPISCGFMLILSSHFTTSSKWYFIRVSPPKACLYLSSPR